MAKIMPQRFLRILDCLDCPAHTKHWDLTTWVLFCAHVDVPDRPLKIGDYPLGTARSTIVIPDFCPLEDAK